MIDDEPDVIQSLLSNKYLQMQRHELQNLMKQTTNDLFRMTSIKDLFVGACNQSEVKVPDDNSIDEISDEENPYAQSKGDLDGPKQTQVIDLKPGYVQFANKKNLTFGFKQVGYDSHKLVTKMLDNLDFGDDSCKNSQLLQTTELKFRTKKSRTYKSLRPMQDQFDKMMTDQPMLLEERNISKINRRVMLPPPSLISKMALFEDINDVAEAMLQMQESPEEPIENQKENISNNKPVDKIGIG